MLLRPLLVLISIFALALTCGAQDAHTDFVGNEFARQYNTWVKLYNAPHDPNMVNAAEIKAWHDTQVAWAKLRHTVRY